MKKNKASAPNIFVSPQAIVDGTVAISDSQHHHLAHVLRLHEGDNLNVLDNQGHLFKTVIEKISKTQTICKILEIISQKAPLSPINTLNALNPSNRKTVLAQAIIKGEKMDWVVQKATELGVSEIVPLFTKNTVVRIDQKDVSKKVERWQAIAQGAAEQCERWDIPVVREPVKLEDLAIADGAQGYYGAVVRGEDHLNLNAGPLNPPKGGLEFNPSPITHDSSLILVIGPEGGLSSDEEVLLTEKGFKPVSLSSNVLRAETAAIVGVGLLMIN